MEKLIHWANTLTWLNTLLEQEAEHLRDVLDGEANLDTMKGRADPAISIT